MIRRPGAIGRPGGMGRRRVIGQLGAAFGAATVTATGCGSSGGGSDSTVRVAAAASLTDVMVEIAEVYEASTGVDVELNLGASSALALQVEEGSPADVFASADIAIVADLSDRAPEVGDPVAFATNELVIAVPVDADQRVDALDDFADDDLILGACAAQVPCGGYAETAFLLADIEPALDTQETDVRSLAAKIASGDLDAGLVYRTDVVAASDSLRAIELPPDARVAATYGVAAIDPSGGDETTTSSPAPVTTGGAFVEFLLSDVAQDILSDAGFGAP